MFDACSGNGNRLGGALLVMNHPNKYADISVIVGVMLLSFIFSFEYFISMARVVPPFLMILTSMVGSGLLTAGILFIYHNGHSEK